MGKVGKGTFQVRCAAQAAWALLGESRTICPLEIGTTMTTFGHVINEHEEPCEGRLSRTVLWEGRGEIPPV
jgi:hypothetical protein